MGDQGEEVRRMMRWAGTGLAGKAVKAVTEPEAHGHIEALTELNFFTTANPAAEAAFLFMGSGYTVVEEHHTTHFRKFTLFRDGRTVNVYGDLDGSAFATVAKGCDSSMFTVMTADSIITPYASSLFSNVCVHNFNSNNIVNNEGDGITTMLPSVCPLLGGRCGRSAWCPRTMRTGDDTHFLHWRFDYSFDDGGEEDLNREKRWLGMDVLWRLGCEEGAGCSTTDAISPIEIVARGLLPNLTPTNFELEDHDNTELIEMLVGEEALTDMFDVV